MPALHCVVGTIRVQPDLHSAGPRAESDDSTLARLLESLAFQESLAGDFRSRGDSLRLLVSTRHSRIQAAAGGNANVQANLPQLLSDLNADYDRLTVALS